MDWGQHGAEASGAGPAITVVVDVLSFTTTLTIAMDAGAEVYPFPATDDAARELARKQDAVLAAWRREAPPDGGNATVSLSPASMRQASGLDRIVLPSPNGSALAWMLRERGVLVLGAAPRNRRAAADWIARWLAGRPGQAVAVIAAGERWPDGSLRPAVEDLWGAGAVISALADMGVTGLTPEARTAAAAFRAIAGHLPAALAECDSGRELIRAGYAEDVAIAAELDTSTAVPVLSGERFINAA
jgi:2-phosphosulfolactate phosphatase